MNNLLEIHDLNKMYKAGLGKELNVFSKVSFSLKMGERMIITGVSGSGKSSLLNLIGGLDRPSKGKIFFEKIDISTFSSDQMADWRNKNIGFIFQFHHLLPDFDIVENVAIPFLISHSGKAHAFKNAKELLVSVGLEDRFTHRPAELSGGEQQRVAIARALINSPNLILADEPTGNLDRSTGRQVHTLLHKICSDNNTALIMVSHNEEFIQYFPSHWVLDRKNLVEVHPN